MSAATYGMTSVYTTTTTFERMYQVKYSYSNSFGCHPHLCTMTPTCNLHICKLHSHSPHPLIPCLFPECNHWFKTSSGLTYHRWSKYLTAAVVIDIEDDESSDSA